MKMVCCLVSLLLLTAADLQAAGQKSFSSRISDRFPSYSGKVEKVQGNLIEMTGTSDKPLRIGAYLRVNGQNRGATPVLIRVVSVEGKTILAKPAGKGTIQPGDSVSGWPRPLRVALVPMSRETLQFLLNHPFPEDRVSPVPIADVLSHMIEKGYGNFQALETRNLPGLSNVFETPLVFGVKILTGFGKRLIQATPYWSGGQATLYPFSVLLPDQTQPVQPVQGEVPAATSTAKPGRSPDASPFQASLPLVEPSSPAAALPGPEASTKPALPGSGGPTSFRNFHDPGHWVRTLELDKRIISITAGSFTGPGKRELAIATPGKIQIYSYRRGRLRGGEHLERGLFSSLYWIDAWDINGDGTDEIIADTDEGIALLAWRDERLVQVNLRRDLAIRRIGNRLFAQNLNDLQSEEDPIRSVRWNGRKWKLGEKLKDPVRSNLFAFARVTDPSPLFISEHYKLTDGNRVLLKDPVGQSNTAGVLGIDLPLLARSVPDKDGIFVIHNRTSWPPFGRTLYNNGGTLLFVSQDGKSLPSPNFRGYLADLVLYDLDGDGRKEILTAQVASGIAGGAYILRYQ